MFRKTGRTGASGADATKRGRQSGQALLELALVAPILILLLGGLVQFALIFETQTGINNEVREAARRAATLPATDQPTAQANAFWAYGQTTSLLGNSQTHDVSRDTIQVCIVNPASPYTTDPSGQVQVVVRITETYRHPLFLPIVDIILDGIDGANDHALAVGTTTEFHVEQPGSNNVGFGGAYRTGGSTASCTP